jgi:hypothetical protein
VNDEREVLANIEAWREGTGKLDIRALYEYLDERHGPDGPTSHAARLLSELPRLQRQLAQCEKGWATARETVGRLQVAGSGEERWMVLACPHHGPTTQDDGRCSHPACHVDARLIKVVPAPEEDDE